METVQKITLHIQKGCAWGFCVSKMFRDFSTLKEAKRFAKTVDGELSEKRVIWTCHGILEFNLFTLQNSKSLTCPKCKKQWELRVMSAVSTGTDYVPYSPHQTGEKI